VLINEKSLSELLPKGFTYFMIRYDRSEVLRKAVLSLDNSNNTS